jgi:perosamine synthetase
MIPCGKQTIEQDDIDAVVAALNSDMLTTGPCVGSFESAFAAATSSRHAVAVSSGTAALHAAMAAVGIGRCAGQVDEVIVPSISFVATANAVVYCGGVPVFADIESSTLRIDPLDVERKITPRTKAIVAMDYGGQPCDYTKLRAIADRHGLKLISDACHSLGASQGGTPVGSLADLTCFSLHPIKQITSGEGGMITTANAELAESMTCFRNHGISTDHWQRAKQATHRYSMQELGFNYRLTDIQCALGESQIKKLSRFTDRRNEIAELYDELLNDSEIVRPLETQPGRTHARHLYVVHWSHSAIDRDEVFTLLRSKGIGVNVHYQPIYQQPFYQRLSKLHPVIANPNCPAADQAYQTILSLPIFPLMTDEEVHLVVKNLTEVAGQLMRTARVAA